MCCNMQQLKTRRVDFTGAEPGRIVVQIVDETTQRARLPSGKRHMFAWYASLAEAGCELLSESALTDAIGPLKHD